MAEAESRQASTTTIILELEMRTKELEDENARTEEENKRILDTLDELNISMALSESWVKELQEDLDAAHVSTTLPPNYLSNRPRIPAPIQFSFYHV